MLKKLVGVLIISLLFATAASADQTAALKSGFNFISFTVTPSVSPSALKQQYAGIEDIYYFNAAAGSFISASEGTLTTLAAGKGYIFKASSIFSITIAGAEPATVGNINLKTGFNLVGFSKMPETITGSALMTSYELIRGFYKWIPASGSFIQLIRNGSGAVEQVDGVDPQLKIGESYFINLASDIQLNYDTDKIIFGTNIVPVVQKAATPVITPASATFTASQTVEITCATAGAKIYYTSNGSAPSASNGTEYGGAFLISSTATIKAIAVKSGYTDSDVASAVYTKSSSTIIENGNGVAHSNIYNEDFGLQPSLTWTGDKCTGTLIVTNSSYIDSPGGISGSRNGDTYLFNVNFTNGSLLTFSSTKSGNRYSGNWSANANTGERDSGTFYFDVTVQPSASAGGGSVE